jgi:hypothetical protein
VTLASVTPCVTSRTQSLEAQPPVAVTDSAFAYVIPATSVITFAGTVGTTGGGSGSPGSGGGSTTPSPTGGGGGGAMGAPFMAAIGLLTALRLILRRRQTNAPLQVAGSDCRMASGGRRMGSGFGFWLF